jgi:RimJ/RimL family protein N-acetyltransferase
MMEAKWVKDPSEVWDRIKYSMTDDNSELVTEGLFIAVFDQDKMAGAFLVKPWSDVCFEIHGGVHPDYWGKGVQVCEVMGRALFTGTSCIKIVAAVPEYNRLMRSCLRRIGMRNEGIVTKAFLKNFRLHDLYLYGICKSQVERSRLCVHRQ